jgi:kynureninase
VRDQLKSVSERSTAAGKDTTIAAAAKTLTAKLTAVEEALYQTKNRASQDPLNYPIRLNNKLAALAGTVASADAAPTAQSYAVYEELAAKVDAELSTLDTVLAEDVPAFNRLVREQDVPAIRPPAR